jgi:RNA-directed DNA polymerase
VKQGNESYRTLWRKGRRRVVEPLRGNTEDAMESGNTVYTKQQRIAELARIHPDVSFTSLAHHIDLVWLYEAFGRTRKDGAPGVDAMTAEEYEKELNTNLRSLLERAKSGTYYAPPVLRAHIPKDPAKNETRPIGMPTFEDKVLQRAAQMVLEPIYEQDFLDCSYGFRPNRSAHDALQALWRQMMDMSGGWIIDLDIRKFFDTMVHQYIREILKRRVSDGVITRLIGKWLKAGVWEAGNISYPEKSTPQDGVISPMLSNIYLHEVLDSWFEKDVKPRLRGKAFLIRYADDAVLGFASEEDARRVMEVLPKRFARYGLTIHPEKTRMVRFVKPDGTNTRGRSQDEDSTFNFLGFTHYWTKSRKGTNVIKRKTEKSRFARALKKIAEWCRTNRHNSVQEQHKTLNQKLRGHYAYYGITGNNRMVVRFYHKVRRVWRKWLMRRSRVVSLAWDNFLLLERLYPLARARIVHSIYLRKATA